MNDSLRKISLKNGYSYAYLAVMKKENKDKFDYIFGNPPILDSEKLRIFDEEYHRICIRAYQLFHKYGSTFWYDKGIIPKFFKDKNNTMRTIRLLGEKQHRSIAKLSSVIKRKELYNWMLEISGEEE